MHSESINTKWKKKEKTLSLNNGLEVDDGFPSLLAIVTTLTM